MFALKLVILVRLFSKNICMQTTEHKKILAVIPARYASTRLPGKMLADLAGKTMIQRVFEQVRKVPEIHRVLIATDHEAIFETAKGFGADVVMTQTTHPSGTDRIQEAYLSLNEHFDYILNAQGDEPFIKPEQIALLANLIKNSDAEIATLVHPVQDTENILNPNVVKVVFDKQFFAIYFSRQGIPFVRGFQADFWLEKARFYRHVGLYAYKSQTLAQITALSASSLEQAEQLEQLRWLENGFKIKVGITSELSMGIDSPEDLLSALAYLAQNPDSE